MNTKDAARRLHESTKHGTEPSHPDRLVPYRRMDPHNAPRPFKEYRDLEETPLPHRLVGSSLPAISVLSGEREEPGALDAPLLATLLFLGGGVTRTAGPPGRRTYFRTAMAAGNLHPVEVYVMTSELDGLAAGVYHFSPLRVTLTRLRDGDHRTWLEISTPVALILTGIPWRTAWKYGERGWRHLYWDAGTMTANLLAAADAHGMGHRTLLGFDDARVEELLGIDGTTEMPLAVVQIGQSGDVDPPSTSLAPLSPEVAPVAPDPIRLPLLEKAQAGSTLSTEEVDDWRARGAKVAKDANTRVQPLDDLGKNPIERIILRRGSTRQMVPRSVPRDHLAWPLAAATRAVGFDLAPGGTLLDHFVNVHEVDAMDPGAYRLGPSGLELIDRIDSPRELSTALCLGQALGGDSAYTVFHCAELDLILDSLGSRGYRAAQFEAGVASGRLALCAFALGLGATGLTFFDDAVSRFFGTPAQPMLVTSVGVPVSPPAPAGSPAEPVQLSR